MSRTFEVNVVDSGVKGEATYHLVLDGKQIAQAVAPSPLGVTSAYCLMAEWAVQAQQAGITIMVKEAVGLMKLAKTTPPYSPDLPASQA